MEKAHGQGVILKGVGETEDYKGNVFYCYNYDCSPWSERRRVRERERERVCGQGAISKGVGETENY